MGDERRVRLLVLFVLLVGACTDDAAERRSEAQRALLRPPDVEKLREQKREAVRIVSEQGELLESDEVVAGVRLPRGFKLVHSLANEWYYRSRGVTLEQLDRYFQSRIESYRIERSPHTVVYEAARPRNTPGAEFVTLRIGVAASDRSAKEIYIRRPDPTARRPLLSDAEIRAEIEAAARVAE